MARSSWLDDDGLTLSIDDQAKRLETFIAAMADLERKKKEEEEEKARRAEQRKHLGMGLRQRAAFLRTKGVPNPFKTAIDQMRNRLNRAIREGDGVAERFARGELRAAGIPARVVTGYLGGEINPMDNYLIVRQSDAHAWSEVWLEDEGWVRFDPTAAVSPERIEQGIYAALPDDAPLSVLSRRDDSWLRSAGLVLDAVNNRWNEWVLGYGHDTQRRFLSMLGLGQSSLWLAVQLLAAVALLALAMLAWSAWRERQRLAADPLGQCWRQVCHYLDQHGLPRRPGEGPRDYLRRAINSRPEQADTLRAILDNYLALQYGGVAAAPGALGALRQRIRELRSRRGQ